MYVYIYVCVYVYIIYIYVCTHIYVYIYIYIRYYALWKPLNYLAVRAAALEARLRDVRGPSGSARVGQLPSLDPRLENMSMMLLKYGRFHKWGVLQ